MSQASYALIGFRAMAASDLQGGTITYAGADYSATVGTFELSQVLGPGGFTPMTLGDVQIADADLTGPDFKTGQHIAVTPNTGPERACQIHAVKQLGALWHLTLRDLNRGA